MKQGRKEPKATWQSKQTASFCQEQKQGVCQRDWQNAGETALFNVRWRGPFEGYR